MWEDPIVEEVRQTRREIEAEARNDIETIFAKALETQKRYAGRLVSCPSSVSGDEEVLSTGEPKR